MKCKLSTFYRGNKTQKLVNRLKVVSRYTKIDTDTNEYLDYANK